jgi:hypothetical protein
VKKFLACWITVFVVMGAASVWGAGHADPSISAMQGETGKAQAAMPGPDGEQLNNYIMKDNPYSKWKLFPGTKQMQKSADPHGAFVTIYANDVAVKSAAEKKGYAEGSVIVKENYSPEKKLLALTTMYKVKGSNPEGGDWFYLRSAPDGKVGGAGKLDGCMKCHAKAKNTDYVFSAK